MIYSTDNPLNKSPSAIEFNSNGLYELEILNLNDPTSYTKGIYLHADKI